MGTRNTRLYFKKMVRIHKPTIFATLETRIHSSNVADFLANMGFTNLYVVEALGYGGEGIWLLWNCNMVKVEVLSAHDQAMTALVTKIDGQTWILIMVYASPNYQIWEQLWQYIIDLGCVVNWLWVIIGDVNQPLEEKDKRGGRVINRNLASKLRQTVDMYNLMDMRFQGPQFMWSNGREGKAKIRERIDKAWCNTHWNQTHDRTCLEHLTRVASDHHPLLLTEAQRCIQEFPFLGRLVP